MVALPVGYQVMNRDKHSVLIGCFQTLPNTEVEPVYTEVQTTSVTTLNRNKNK